MRPRITLIEKQERVRKRMEESRLRLEKKENMARLKLSERIERLQVQARKKVGELRQDVRALEYRVNLGARMVYPSPAQRQFISRYREENCLTIRTMARLCEVDSRQIKSIESDSLSIYMSETAMNRILRRVELPEVVAVGTYDGPRVRTRNTKKMAAIVRPEVLTGAGRKSPMDPIVVPRDSKYVWPDPELRKQIMEFRIQKGWSLYQMVKATGYLRNGERCYVSRQSLQEIEGARPAIWMYVDTLDKIVRTCGMPPIQIEGGGTVAGLYSDRNTESSQGSRWKKDLVPAQVDTVGQILTMQAEGLKKEEIQDRLAMKVEWAFQLIEEYRLKPTVAPVALEARETDTVVVPPVEVKAEVIVAETSEREWLWNFNWR